jgi:hypothetical protein
MSDVHLDFILSDRTTNGNGGPRRGAAFPHLGAVFGGRPPFITERTRTDNGTISAQRSSVPGDKRTSG